LDLFAKDNNYKNTTINNHSNYFNEIYKQKNSYLDDYKPYKPIMPDFSDYDKTLSAIEKIKKDYKPYVPPKPIMPDEDY